MIKKVAVSIQEFLFKFFSFILSIIKIVILTDLSERKINTKKINNSAIILGNGPSLNEFLNQNKNFLENKDLIAVNHFADTHYFEQLCPLHYVLNAPELWSDNVEQSHIDRSIKLFTNIAQKTNWEMYLYLHPTAKKSDRWRKIINSNNFIKIRFYNPTPVDGFNCFVHYCFKNNLGMPRPHNVLIPSLLISINLKYKNIYIAGADHSWLKDIWVADDNRVLLTQKHFYDENTAKAAPMHKEGIGERKMHEVLIKMVHAFRSYFVINDYAKEKNIRIQNITKDSYIDAFDRLKL